MGGRPVEAPRYRYGRWIVGDSIGKARRQSPAILDRMAPSPQRLPATECPRCQQRLNAAARPGEPGGPRPGDLAVCAYCGLPMAYTPSLTVRRLSKSEMESLGAEEALELMDRMRMVRSLRSVLN